MPRQPRHIRPGLFYHILNRSAGRIPLFRKPADYDAFLRILSEAHQKFPLPLIDWCLMNNHWHFPSSSPPPPTTSPTSSAGGGLTHTHAMRWRVARNTVGYRHLYQGRFKAFPIEEGNPLRPTRRPARRYVQHNALSAGLVKHAPPRAHAWPYSSLHTRLHGPPELAALLSKNAPKLMPDWTTFVNQPLTRKELTRLRPSTHRGTPFGSDPWTRHTAKSLHLDHTLRPKGRPRKKSANEKKALRPL